MPTRRWHIPAVGLAAAALTVAPLATDSALAATSASTVLTSTVQTSTGWGGYQASGSDIASVSASWTVPTASCGSASSAANLYVGLGGTPITGVLITCSYGIAQYEPWMDLGMPAVPIYTVSPGDSVTGSATYQGIDAGSGYYHYVYSLTDHTQNWTESVDVYNGGSMGGSAQAGVEPDSIGDVGGFCIDFCFTEWVGATLADFGTVDFIGAAINGTAFGSAAPAQTDLVSGGTTEVSPSGLDSTGKNFSITYQ